MYMDIILWCNVGTLVNNVPCYVQTKLRKIFDFISLVFLSNLIFTIAIYIILYIC